MEAVARADVQPLAVGRGGRERLARRPHRDAPGHRAIRRDERDDRAHARNRVDALPQHDGRLIQPGVGVGVGVAPTHLTFQIHGQEVRGFARDVGHAII